MKKQTVKMMLDNMLTETGYNTLMTMILNDPNNAIGIFEYARRIEEREVALIEKYSEIISNLKTN